MTTLEWIFYIIFTVSVLSFLSLAPWVPTRKEDLKRVDDIIKLQKWENFLEMWCGTWKVSLYLAKSNKESFITWIELSPFFYLISKIRIFFSKQQNIEIRFWNALKENLDKYNVIYCFWLPETVTEKIFPKIKYKNNKKFRFISYCFKMTNDYFKETRHKEENRYAIYEYKL